MAPELKTVPGVARVQTRVIADVTHFQGLMDVAYNQIRQSADGEAAVLIALARRLSDLLQIASSDEQRQALVKHLQMLERAAQAIPEPLDRQALLSVIAGARERQGTESGMQSG